MSYYKRYAEYTRGGVFPDSRHPKSWEEVPLRRVILNCESGTSVNAADWPAEEDELGVLKTSAVYGSNLRVSENKTVVPEDRKRVNCPLRQGTLIVSRMNTPDLVGAAGYVSRAPHNLFLPDRLWQITFSDRLDVRFAHYWTQSEGYRTAIKLACSGTSSSMQNLSQDQFRSIPIALGSYSEQKRIVDFLDRKTARIDALIEKKTRFIELLKEKRQALITQAVTKGLDPTVPMKDSGVEWIGEVPAHWVLMQVGHLLSRIEQGKSPECESTPAEGDEWGVLKTGCVNGGEFKPRENKKLPHAAKPHSQYEVVAGDLLMSRASGSIDLIGSAAYVAETPPRILLSDKIFRLKYTQRVSPRYLVMALGSRPSRQQIELAINGAEGLANNITKPSIKAIRLVIPPFSEQVEIVEKIGRRVLRIDQILEKTGRSTELLRERRSALITAAVTGQIDLREDAA